MDVVPVDQRAKAGQSNERRRDHKGNPRYGVPGRVIAAARIDNKAPPKQIHAPVHIIPAATAKSHSPNLSPAPDPISRIDADDGHEHAECDDQRKPPDPRWTETLGGGECGNAAPMRTSISPIPKRRDPLRCLTPARPQPGSTFYFLLSVFGFFAVSYSPPATPSVIR